MADYLTLDAAIAAGVTNMTVLRNNSKNDDSTVSYSTGIDWFVFNTLVCSTIYSSGNSWIGFGTGTEQLKVNRRDTAVYYEYKETGTIQGIKFFKFTWRGYSAYNQTGSSYAQAWDFYLFETGHIFLNFWQVPTSQLTGTNSLICGSQTVSFSVTSGTPCQYTFTPSDAERGTGWSVAAGQPNLSQYASSGNAEYAITSIRGVDGICNGVLYWDSDVPTDTSVTVQVKLDSGTYAEATNGQNLPINWQGVTSSSILYVKILLETSNPYLTPSVKSLRLELYGSTSQKKVVLIFGSGTTDGFRNAVGPITVIYDGTGFLAGEGGPVEAFEETFTPTDLLAKPNQNDAEHIELAMSVTGSLLRVYTTDTLDAAKIDLTIVPTGTLTHINDL